MRKYFSFFVSIVLIAAGCSKLDSTESENDIWQMDSENANVVSAYGTFAKILSSSLSSNEELREFVKTSALQQFDNDYDVFYPYVKDKVVEGGRSFKDYLLEYSSEAELSQIEQLIPKLTVLVPDWSWYGCFTVNEWDTSSDEIAVCYEDESGKAVVFADGKYVGTLPESSLPDFPMLVLKSNERMIQLTDTKGGEPCFDFADEAFNGITTKVQHEISYPVIDGVPDQTSLVPASSISQRVRDAYDVFPIDGDPQYQRDYIYWGMTKNSQTGILKSGVYEVISKIRLNDWQAYAFNDDCYFDYTGDFYKEGVASTWNFKNNRIEVTKDVLRDHFYSEGCLEIHIDASIPYISGNKMTISKVVSVPFGRAFAIDKARLDFRHKTWFCQDWYVFDVYKSYVYSKWIDVNIRLPRWDISRHASIITLVFTEFDETGSSEITYQYETQNTNSFKIDFGVEGGKDVTIKTGLGYSNSYSNTTLSSAKITRSQGGIDQLGQMELDYVSPIFIGKEERNGRLYYEYDTYSTGTGMVDVMMIPLCY